MEAKPSALQTIGERFENVRARIRTAAERAGRSPSEIALIAISKTHSVEAIREALAAGVSDLGENRVQEADSKINEIGRDVARWHLVGHLQTNKARRAVELFDVIHSVDSGALVEKLERLCVETERPELPVLVQVDLAGEQTKSGVDSASLPTLLDAFTGCDRVTLVGLMTLPPFFEDPECTRPFFKALRDLRDELKTQGHFHGPGELSMGMSHDFEVAIEEGATMVRVGTSIFGERSKP
ncbi:MAG TPA: YggS family pyridoxal phosphate-dependent enzyme [Pyrinomonadaceae bacterium]|nr:YggS family pyridoxal phosphate-dependent enzyme [Pyrinomonadaceae bacterium]